MFDGEVHTILILLQGEPFTDDSVVKSVVKKYNPHDFVGIICLSYLQQSQGRFGFSMSKVLRIANSSFLPLFQFWTGRI